MKTYLTDRFFALFAICQLLGVFSLVSRSLLVPYLLTWPVGFLVLWLEWKSLPSRGAFSFDLKVPGKIETGQTITIRLNMLIGNLRPGKQRLAIALPASNLLRFSKSSIDLAVGRLSAISKEVQAKAYRLGFEEWREVTFLAYSPLGLWTQIAEVEMPHQPFRVFPARTKSSPQVFTEMARNQQIFQTGSRRILRSREPAQFHSIRNYQYPDPVRYIDAKRTARYQRLMTRTYDSLLTHNLVIGLDIGRSLIGQLGQSAKHDYYVSASLAIAENALQSHDKVSLLAFSQRVHHLIRPTGQFGAFLPLYRGDSDLIPREEESNYQTFVLGTQQVAAQRSLVLLFTDFSKPSVQNAVLPALSVLSQKHLVVVAGVIDRQFNLVDSVLDFSGNLTPKRYSHFLYTYWLNERIRNFQYQAAKFGVGTVLVHEQDWMSVVIQLYSLMRASIRM